MSRRNVRAVGRLRAGESRADESVTPVADPKLDALRELREADEQAAVAKLPFGWRPIPDPTDRAIIDAVLRLGRSKPTAIGDALAISRWKVHRRLTRLAENAQRLTITTRAILSGEDPKSDLQPVHRRGDKLIGSFDPDLLERIERAGGLDDLDDLLDARAKANQIRLYQFLLEMDPDLLGPRPVPAPRCPHCGRFVGLAKGSGRPRKWCAGRRGDRCRKRFERRPTR